MRTLSPWIAALAMIAVVTTASTSHALEPRMCIDLFSRGHSALNPTAAYNGAEYRMPNDRKWRDYVRLLFKGFNEARESLKDGDTVIDLGGGQGRAMYDLTQTRAIDAIVVNTQDFTGTYPADTGKGRLSYRAGWAEDVLASIPSKTAGAVFDVFGAFHYSAHKDVLIEETYRVLKPGRSANFLFDFENSPAFVGDVRLDHWLRAKYPKIFSVRYIEFNSRRICILQITKPWLSFRSLKLGLEIEAADMNPRQPVVPRVRYRVRS